VSDDLTPGDILELTGICKLTTTQPMPRAEWVEGFRIELAEGNGIRVFRKAPWWTQGRLLTALGVTGVLGLASMLGVLVLRRQVAAQLKVIGDKLRAEAVHTERDRMAQELHDTLEQQLAGVSLQIDGIARAASSNPGALESRVALARRMIRHTRAEARRSLWDLRSRILEKAGLSAALRELGETVSRTIGSPEVDTVIAETLPDLPKGVDFHMLRIAQEAIGNAVKHASATRIQLRLEVTDGMLRLLVADDGSGFQTTGHLNDPSHFGMVGMRQRAERIGASLVVDSSPDRGTRISVELPLPTLNSSN
jgi:signal transduction histidine kinase